jgi:hypothetical protein
MSKKISIREKREWLDMYEQGKTEVQIAREKHRDPRTIVKGIEEASKNRRLASAEAEMLRSALFKHQDQLADLLKNIASMLVMPPDNLEMIEERENVLAPISFSGSLLKHPSKEQMTLTIHAEDKLEWEILYEHLKQEKLWESIKQWRKALIDYIWARWQYKLMIKSKLTMETNLKSSANEEHQSSIYLLRELVNLLQEVTSRRILGVKDTTNMEKAIDSKLSSYNDTSESRDNIISVYTSLPETNEAYKIKNTHEELARITRLAKRQADEILLLGMITGKCRVCRRLGR